MPRTAKDPKNGKDIPVFELFHDIKTPLGKSEREALKNHGNNPCYFDYGPDSDLKLMYIEAPQGREDLKSRKSGKN